MKHDTAEGPCACGAWHTAAEWRERAEKAEAALRWYTSSGDRCPGCNVTERQDHKKGCWCYALACGEST